MNARPTITVVAQRVGEQMGVPFDDIAGDARTLLIVEARHLVWWIAVRVLRGSFLGTARQWGVDNATMRHGVLKMDRRLRDLTAAGVDLWRHAWTVVRDLGLAWPGLQTEGGV
jgi:hypothetical protein